MTNYLKNAWYMIAWGHELEAEPLCRKAFGEKLVLFRDQAGDAATLIDRCPHRFAPLSRGKVVADGIQCGYHGLTFATDGRCIRNALKGPLPKGAAVRSFPLHERDEIVWLWPGDPAAADPDTIPDFSYISEARRKNIFGLSTMQANYRLVIDNLMDLSHVEFLHPAIGGALSENGKHAVKHEGTTVHSNWLSENVPNTVSLETWYPTNGKRIDHRFDMRWEAPSNIYLGVSATLAGHTREEGFTLPSAHLLTPETESSTHYFWHGSLPADHPQPLDELRKIFTVAFDEEDAPMLEAVQESMGDADRFWEFEPVMLHTDSGALRARRELDRLLAAEAK